MKRFTLSVGMTVMGSVSPVALWAQAGGGMSWGSIGLISTIVIVILGAVVVVSENLLKVEAKRSGVDLRTHESSGLQRLFQPKLPTYLKGEKVHLLKKGYDIKLVGKAEVEGEIPLVKTTRYSLQPPNFRGIRPIPKLEVEEGDKVKAGDPIFYDKEYPEVKYVAPVSGEFVELQRGAKRAIVNLVILADQDEFEYREFPEFDLENSDRQALKEHLMATGGWPLIEQRPFNTVPDPEKDPKSIFISTFDSSPLAPNLNFAVQGKEDDFQKGIEVLNHLTDGKVYLGLDGRGGEPPAEIFRTAKGAEKHYFSGPHPAGNVGVHIHHVDPIRSGDAVWTVDVQNVITIGAIFSKRKYLAERVVAVAGSEVKDPTYLRAHDGANIGELLQGKLRETDNRIINGNVLVGNKKSDEDYLDVTSKQITVIQEGDYYEPFGWLVPSKLKPSVSRTYPNFLFPDMKLKADTNTHGEKRAFVVTGQYEKLLPMDIYLQHLMKSIMINDFERMEGLGILELSEEDVALPEFACTSKMPLQNILREGLDYVKTQM